MRTQTTAQYPVEVPATPVILPPFQGDSTFWTIVAIAILVKVLLGNLPPSKSCK
ncbi:hypothetical protein [Coleofasciculus sp. FACHB-1120]|uniref:hypothetical protein n=1 Tax=Coleofasciculus sp. FACHB-1120 TaxID=2692783 RepID=UPI0016883D1C|nr:hypothetical protein [Coleofasciculus sp. FACHB-1120]MBD2740030.1 hypothetical protein [Coleofasciculus sp. FACHB-1120]